jgi:cation diffusion facilitator family transporter
MKGSDAVHAAGLEATCPLECEALPPPGPPLEEVRRRAAAVRRVFVVTLVLNLVVAAAKGAYGFVSGSVSITADAFHSLLDAASNVLALVGMHFSGSPADAGHPYGHRKFEVVAALGIGVLIAVSLFEIASAAVTALAGRRPPPDVGWPGFAVVIGTIAVNTFVTRYESRWGRRLQSPLLVADAHHTRSDIYTSAAVLVAFVGAELGLGWADGVCGLLVVVMVGRVAWEVFRENVPSLVDAAVLDPTEVRTLAAGLGAAGVRNIHAVRSRGTKWAAELDLHLAVDPAMSVEDAHALAHRVEDALRAGMPHIKDVVVHVEPAAPSGVKSK